MISHASSWFCGGTALSADTIFWDGIGRTSSSDVLVSSKVSSKSVLLSLDSRHELSFCLPSNPDAVGSAELEFMGLGLGDVWRMHTDFLDTDRVC